MSTSGCTHSTSWHRKPVLIDRMDWSRNFLRHFGFCLWSFWNESVTKKIRIHQIVNSRLFLTFKVDAKMARFGLGQTHMPTKTSIMLTVSTIYVVDIHIDLFSFANYEVYKKIQGRHKDKTCIVKDLCFLISTLLMDFQHPDYSSKRRIIFLKRWAAWAQPGRSRLKGY